MKCTSLYDVYTLLTCHLLLAFGVGMTPRMAKCFHFSLVCFCFSFLLFLFRRSVFEYISIFQVLHIYYYLSDKMFSMDQSPPEVHANAAETLCAITRNAPSALATKLSSPRFIYMYLFTKNSSLLPLHS